MVCDLKRVEGLLIGTGSLVCNMSLLQCYIGRSNSKKLGIVYGLCWFSEMYSMLFKLEKGIFC
jgi:hypothetical protein